MNLKKYIVIVAGGSGSRMKASLPKQFLLLQGKPILQHSLEKFHSCMPEAKMIVVLPTSHFKTWEDLCEKHHITVPHQVIEGGGTRFQSVKNALEEVEDNGLVAIHDAVRPLISLEVISNAFSAALDFGSAIPAVPMENSIRKIIGEHSKHADRSRYRIIQTPQVFRSQILLEAYQQTYSDFFTDDASVVEKAGYSIHLIEGNKANIKITTPEDMTYAETYLK